MFLVRFLVGLVVFSAMVVASFFVIDLTGKGVTYVLSSYFLSDFGPVLGPERAESFEVFGYHSSGWYLFVGWETAAMTALAALIFYGSYKLGARLIPKKYQNRN